MSDENTEVGAEAPEVIQEEQQQENQQEGGKEPSAVEQRALEMGWRPKEDFEGNEEDFIDATEFVRRKPLFEKIDHVGKELRETKKALKALQEHHAKVRESEYQNALKQLRAEKKQALEDGDADALIDIDERLAAAKAEEVQQQAQYRQQAAAPHPNFVQWVSSNQWYTSDAELRVAADQIGVAYSAKNPEISPDDVLKYVEKRIKTVYSDKFKNQNKGKPSAVEGVKSNAPTSKKDEDYPLTDEERRVMNTFVRQGIMTKEEYIKDLKMVKE